MARPPGRRRVLPGRSDSHSPRDPRLADSAYALVRRATGVVSYGGQLLCSPAEVSTVDVVPARGGEMGDCEVVLSLRGGRQQTIPSQYFGSYKSREHARPFAEELAQALSVPVKW